jgi:protocatechuate 3,4-dioxygenase beta subunit
VVLILFLSANSFGQEIVIKGKITDIDNRDIQNASVSILDAKGIVLNIHLQ